MALSVPGHWIWDFWLAQQGEEWHIFFLRAPRTILDPELRHINATIGHARSTDLRTWEVLPDPFGLGDEGEWDDAALWTGSCVWSGEQWWMFYTAVSTTDDAKIQRIGAATSTDLRTWDKVAENPLCTADPRWYETYDPNAWYEEAWRDPHVFPDPEGSGFHMFITARTNEGLPDRRGVIGHATSKDLLTWEVRPPVARPDMFGHLEVSQHLRIGNHHYVLFCVHRDWQPTVPLAEKWTGTGYLMADVLEGPYVPGPTPFLVADRRGTSYAGKIVEIDGELLFLATRHETLDGEYIGSISDPVRIVVGEDGSIAPVHPWTPT